jgi:TRAP-type C4-dicarboxylate transport system permease small subunit
VSTGERRASTAGVTVIDAVLQAVRGLLAVLRVLAGLLLVASVLLNFANVIARYFFSASLYWAEEVMLFLMVGCVFLGRGVVAWSGRQIKMDVVVSMMPPKAREALDVFSELVFIAVAITIVVFAWPVIHDLFDFDQRSQSAEIPLYIPQALIPIGLGIMAILVSVRLIIGIYRDPPGSTDH